MMAAIRAGQLNQDVTLIEKNQTLGKKLLLSGKGRCNLTNLCTSDSFLKRFSKKGQFLRDAFKKFFNTDLVHFFETRGLKLKIERQQRVFPWDDKSSSVTAILKKELTKNKVKIMPGIEMKDVVVHENKVRGIILEPGGFLPVDKIILATGGVSYSFTGSSGDGIKIAKKLGHSVTALRPGLVPLETRQNQKTLQGLTLKNIRLKFRDGKKQLDSGIGELLFTDFGISGPLVLSLSSRIVDWLREGRSVCAEIDLKPALSTEQLNARFLREIKENSKKSVQNTLKNLLPQKLIRVFLEISRINPHKLAGQVTKEERKNLIGLFKGLRLDIVKSRPIDDAMITQGGVSLKDINPRSMESRKIKGLYFCGEMIDVDADTGGFNLQAAFSTGYLAGESASLN